MKRTIMFMLAAVFFAVNCNADTIANVLKKFEGYDFISVKRQEDCSVLVVTGKRRFVLDIPCRKSEDEVFDFIYNATKDDLNENQQNILKRDCVSAPAKFLARKQHDDHSCLMALHPCSEQFQKRAPKTAAKYKHMVRSIKSAPALLNIAK